MYKKPNKIRNGIHGIDVNNPTRCSIWIKFEICNGNIYNDHADRCEKFQDNHDFYKKNHQIQL